MAAICLLQKHKAVYARGSLRSHNSHGCKSQRLRAARLVCRDHKEGSIVVSPHRLCGNRARGFLCSHNSYGCMSLRLRAARLE